MINNDLQSICEYRSYTIKNINIVYLIINIIIIDNN